MRLATVVWLLACVGCDRVWQLDVVLPADADLDLDDDGVLDETDNCPGAANTDQDDEDADLIGDVCDLCPITSDATDTDMDGVGDTCDPHPTTPGEVLALFESFQQGVPPPPFSTSDNWMASNGDVWIAAVMGTRASLYVPARSTRETISTAMRMTSTVGTDYRVAGIKDNAAFGSNAASIICSVVITAASDPSFQNTTMIDMYRLPGGAVLERKVYTWSLDEDVVLTMTRSGDRYTCTASNTVSSATVSGTDPAVTAMPQVGLHAEDAEVHYSWLMIVTSP